MRKKEFILSKKEIEDLEKIYKKSKSYEARNKARALILRNEGYFAKDIANIFKVEIRTVFNWTSEYKKYGKSSLFRKKGQGRKSILNESDKKIIEKVAKDKSSAKEILIELIENYRYKDLKIDTLKNFLKKNRIFL